MVPPYELALRRRSTQEQRMACFDREACGVMSMLLSRLPEDFSTASGQAKGNPGRGERTHACRITVPETQSSSRSTMKGIEGKGGLPGLLMAKIGMDNARTLVPHKMKADKRQTKDLIETTDCVPFSIACTWMRLVVGNRAYLPLRPPMARNSSRGLSNACTRLTSYDTCCGEEVAMPMYVNKGGFVEVRRFAFIQEAFPLFTQPNPNVPVIV